MIRYAVVVASALGCATLPLLPPAAWAHTSTSSAVEQAERQIPPAPPNLREIPDDATRTESGLASKILTPGSGTEKPGPDAYVVVQYTGWTAAGAVIDSSYEQGAPATFPMDRVIKGWAEGVQLMVVGEKRRLWIPEKLAYDGQPGRPTGMVVYDVELLEIMTSPTTPPPDVTGPPADAQYTASGLAYKMLRTGSGGPKPTSTSRVTVHYSGWTTDGKLFDSSVLRGAPATLSLTEVIAGWTEGVQLLSPGDKARFWIPEALAYQGRNDGPQGMLVFDIELIAVEEPGHADR